MVKLLGYFHAVGLVGSKLSISCVFDGVDLLKSGSLIPIPHSMFLVPMFLIPKLMRGHQFSCIWTDSSYGSKSPISVRVLWGQLGTVGSEFP